MKRVMEYLIKKDRSSPSLHLLPVVYTQEMAFFDPVFNNSFLTLLGLHTRCLIDYR